MVRWSEDHFEFFVRAGRGFFRHYHLSEEIKSQQRGFAALPGKDDLIAGHACNVLLNEQLQHFVRHPAGTRAFGKILLAQVIAVCAIEIASGTDRLGHDMKLPPPKILREPRGVKWVTLAIQWTFHRNDIKPMG